MFPWEWQIVPFFELLVVEIGYLLAIGPLRHRFSGSAPVGHGVITAFTLGIVICVLALVTPLDALSGYLLTAHMVQHLLLTLIAPPLLLFGTPGWLVRPLITREPVASLARAMTRPIAAFLIFNITFLGWHAPRLYDLALSSLPIHILEHLLFLGTAIIAWWPVVGPLPEIPRASYPIQILYLFVQSIPATIVGAIITLSNDVIYTTYANVPRIWGMGALEDQTIGGLIMWIPGAFIFLGALTIVFFLWMQDNETESVVYKETVEGRRLP